MNRRTRTFPLTARADAPVDAIEQSTGEQMLVGRA